MSSVAIRLDSQVFCNPPPTTTQCRGIDLPQLWTLQLLTLLQCGLPFPRQRVKWAGPSSTEKPSWTSQHANENKSPGTFLRQTEDLEEQYLAELKASPSRLRQQLGADDLKYLKPILVLIQKSFFIFYFFLITVPDKVLRNGIWEMCCG